MFSVIISTIKKSVIKNIPKLQNTRILYAANIKENNLTSNQPKDSVIVKKFNEINSWYVQLTGLDEIKRLQDKVIQTQERLERAQEERREIGKLLVEIRRKSSEIQEQLHQVKRWENVQKFLDLTRLETELLKEERDLTAKFEVLDKTEREIFTSLSNAVRDSHEKEKSQSEYTKYWGIILSIVGTIIGAVVSTIISTVRNYQLVGGINKGVEEKFNKITKMYNESNLINGVNIDNILEKIKQENEAEINKIILNSATNQNKFSENIIEILNENTQRLDKIINTTYLVPLSDSQKNNYINADKFVENQRKLLENYQKEIRTSLVISGICTLLVLIVGLASINR